jgi:membrane fusion protein (multidrug efflux system)
VGSRVDPVTRAIAVRAHIANEDRALRPGMLLTVSVVMAEREALVVPENAVFQVQDRAFVFALDDDLVAHERRIATGERRFGIVEVLDGLAAGERIVTEGIVKLRDGTSVRLEAAAPVPDPAGSGGPADAADPGG